MIIRLVKMHFRPEAVPHFLQLFEERKSLIRNFPGCQHLELWKSADHPDQYFTYSLWESPSALADYRQSDFFTSTWQETKGLFAKKAEAWSVERVEGYV